MRVSVRVKPKSKRPGVTQVAEGEYVIAVSEPADRGAANRAVTKALAEHFHIAPSLVTLVSGTAGHNKVFDLPN